MHASHTALGAAAAAQALVEAIERGQRVALIACLDTPNGPERVLVHADGSVIGSLGSAELDAAATRLALEQLERGGAVTTIVQTHGGAHELYVEAHRPVPRLVIVGAGHIALPLARLGALLGFDLVVLDDREEFATSERFPDAARVERVDFSHPFRDLELGDDAYVLLVTRAHKYDYDCLRALLELPRPPRYIGMIGSRRRVRAAFTALLTAGVPRARLDVVHAPVGLDIGAETPEEIAVSIAAELVAFRRGAPLDNSLARKERVLDRLLPPPEE